MNKEFIPYELALELKELGFDEPCLKYWNGIGEYFDQKDWFNWNQVEKFVSIPLYQQALRWFREKYNLKFHIRQDNWNNRCSVYILISDEHERVGDYLTYEETELKCLKKLIETVKTK